MSNDLDDIVKRLQSITLDGSPADFNKLAGDLDRLIDADPATYESLNLQPALVPLLVSGDASTAAAVASSSCIELHTKVAKCIAEITKIEKHRRQFTDPATIQRLINILAIEPYKRDLSAPTLAYVIQCCRALGNICYSNDDAHNLLIQLNSDEVLIRLLDIVLQPTDDAELKELHVQFVKVRCGLISNYLVGGEVIAKRAIDLHIMDKFERIVAQSAKAVDENEDLLLNTLAPLTILTENVSELNFSESQNRQLVKILGASKNPDIAEMCLDLLHDQAENDDVKLLLAKEGLCETIYQLLEKYKTLASTNEARALMKLACDLVVLILTGDESMHYLYTTPFLKYIEDWLESCDTDLLTTGVLALGNFARTDSHCIYMVENNISTKLLEILAKNNGTQDDMRLQHALLSALRNLVIPKPNKAPIIKAGLVETILPMLQIHQPPVVFKLLGTLRMTVDGQEKLALELLCNTQLIGQLVFWGKSCDYANVTGESLRLMAWLVKHAYYQNRNAAATASSSSGGGSGSNDASAVADDTSLKAFVQTNGAVECMINMLTSQHLVMQNEALIALSIISVVLCRKNQSDINLDEMFIACNIGEKMAIFIGKSSDTMTKEIVENLQTFMSLLRTSENLINHLNEHNIDELLKSIPILTEYCTL